VGTSSVTAVPLQVSVVPATAERWDDVRSILGISAPQGCFCLYWRLSSSDFSRTRGAERAEVARRLVEAGPAPGVLAYAGDQVVGWCSFGPRSSMERLVRSRTIPKIDEVPVWSIVCFVVRAGFRRRGVARALLAGAIDYAAACGATVLEAYPIDPDGRRVNTSDAYVGTVGMFERAGFHRVVETDAHSARLPRWLMRLELPAVEAGGGRPTARVTPLSGQAGGER
jgi:GNAT superfamily N-acetyltransferase